MSTITIYIRSGVVVDVEGLNADTDFQVIDLDENNMPNPICMFNHDHAGDSSNCIWHD